MDIKITNKLTLSITKEQVMSFAPFLIGGALFVVFCFSKVIPDVKRWGSLRKQLAAKNATLLFVSRSGADYNTINREIKELESRVMDAEKKLPKASQTNILVDTLKDITAASRFKFSSIEPQPQRDPDSGKKGGSYTEMPIRVKLSCGYYDLISFLEKIETAERFLKVTSFSIKASPTSLWEQDVDLSISTFASLEDAKAEAAPDSSSSRGGRKK